MKRITLWISLVLIAATLSGCPDDTDLTFTDLASPESLPLTTGLHTITSGGVERQFYVHLPSDYEQRGYQASLIIAYHGTGGTYEAWVDDGYYQFESDVGDGAILIYPQALPDAAGTYQWDYDWDFQFFEDLLLRFQRGLRYDRDKLFVTGHSSGGGFAHELGCRFGDVIRGTAPVAGGLLSIECTGSVGVIQIHGANDVLVPVGVADVGRVTWIAYNGFDAAINGTTPYAQCVDYSLGVGSYPVWWCLHEEGSTADFSGHGWPSFAGEAIWGFFSSLPTEAQSDTAPPGGGNERIQDIFDTTISFTLRYPQGMGTVVATAIAAYPEGTVQATGAPTALLNTSGFAIGSEAPGAEIAYQVPIQFGSLDIPGTYSIQFAIYIEGGGQPIPVAGIDHVAIIDVPIMDKSLPVVIDTPIDVAPVP